MLVITPPVILINVISPLAVSLWLFKSTVPFSILEFVTWDVISLFIVNVPLVNVELLILLIDDTVLAFNELLLKLTVTLSPNATSVNDELKFSLIVTVPFVIVDLLISLIDESLFAVKVLLFKLTFTLLFTLSPNTTLANDELKFSLIVTVPLVIVDLLISLIDDSVSAVKVLLFKLTFTSLFTLSPNTTLANDVFKLLLIETLPFVIVELLILLTVDSFFAVKVLLFKSTSAILFNVTSANDEVKSLLIETLPFVIVELSILLTDEPLLAVNEWSFKLTFPILFNYIKKIS